MTRASKIIIGLGIFVVIIPLLGFTGVVKDGLTVIVGLAIAVITYWAGKHAKFCPECNLPENMPHRHHNGSASDSYGGAGKDEEKTPASSESISFPPSVLP